MGASTPWLITAVVLAATVAALALWARRGRKPHAAPPPAASSTGTTVLEMQKQSSKDGSTVAALPPSRWQRFAGRFRRRPERRSFWIVGLLAILAVVVAVGATLWWQPDRIANSRAGQFVVLVAPFRDSGGDVGQTGRTVATQLAAALRQGDSRLVVEQVSDAPAGPDEAYALAMREQADVVLWGDVQPGGVLDQESLLPRIAYAPNGLYAPNAWDGYADRFALPRSFVLARAPLNGGAVLPPLLSALRRYGDGDADLAFDGLGELATNYPALLPALPGAVRGNVLWARGALDQAADEYRRALALPADDAGRLANNLGAILIDAGDSQALGALEQSSQLLNGTDLAALRYNFALIALDQRHFAEASSGLQVARDLVRNAGQQPGVPLLVTASRAAREEGRYPEADTLLKSAERQIEADTAAVPAAFRDTLRNGLRGDVQEERGMLYLVQQVGGDGPLSWRLEASPPLTSNAVEPARTAFDAAVQASSDLLKSWRYAEASQGANDRPGASIIANGQARRAERASERRQIMLAMTQIEQGRATIGTSRGVFRMMLDVIGAGSAPLNTARGILEQQIQNDPASIEALNQYGRLLRLQQLWDAANQQYDAIIAAAPARPEGVAGKGMVALALGDANAGRNLLNEAIGRDSRYYPARLALAQIALDQGDWPTAISQFQWLATNRHQPQDTIMLAQALRRSGPASLAQARDVLLPLVDATPPNADALIELGRVYADAGQRADAVQSYRDALKVAPRSSPAAFELGQLLAADGKLAEAEASLRSAVEFDPNNRDARLALADVYAAEGKADNAAEMYRSAANAGGGDLRTLTDLGDKLLVQNHAAEAADAYRRAIELRPSDRQLHHKLGQAYLAQNNLDAARQSEQRALDLANGAYPEALVGLGDIERQSGNLDRADQLYNQALSQDAALHTAKIGLGQTAASRGNWAVALGYFQAAAQQAANDPLAQFWTGEALLRQNRLPEAAAAYKRAIELRGAASFPEALLGLAQVQDAAGDTAAAAATIDQAIAQRPNYAEAFLFSGKLREKLGQSDQALKLYNSAITSNSGLAEPYYRRALLAIQRSDLSGASTDLQRAAAIQPIFPEANYWLGRIAFAQERFDQAQTSFQNAIDQAGGGYPEAQLYMGLTLEQKGDLAGAGAQFRAVSQADQGGEWGGKADQELRRLGL